MDGYEGKILRIDSSKEETEKKNLEPEFAKQWLGGRGFIAKLLYEELPKGVDPLGPENKLVIAPGPLSGTFWPNTAKIVFGDKIPIDYGLWGQ